MVSTLSSKISEEESIIEKLLVKTLHWLSKIRQSTKVDNRIMAHAIVIFLLINIFLWLQSHLILGGALTFVTVVAMIPPALMIERELHAPEKTIFDYYFEFENDE